MGSRGAKHTRRRIMHGPSAGRHTAFRPGPGRLDTIRVYGPDRSLQALLAKGYPGLAEPVARDPKSCPDSD